MVVQFLNSNSSLKENPQVKMLIMIFPLLLNFLLVGCDDGEVRYVDKLTNASSESLIAELDNMQNSIEEGHVLRYGTRQEKQEIKEILYRFRSYTMKLNRDPQDSETTKAYYLLFKKFEALDYVERDTGFFMELTQKVRVVLNHYASSQGLNFSDLRWTLYSHAFVDGIKPFQENNLTPEGAIWEMALGKFAKIGGRGTPTENWLISPAYSLKKITQLSLAIKHTVRNPDWGKFQVFVSTEYDGKTIDINQWHELNIEPKQEVPENKWFDLETGEMNLEQFLGQEKLYVAFRYRSESENNTVWEVLSLEFKGTK